MELLKTMQHYFELNQCYPGNDYWGKLFEKATEADKKSFPLGAEVKPDACVKVLINELEDMLSVLSGIDPILDRYATLKMLENRIKELKDIGTN